MDLRVRKVLGVGDAGCGKKSLLYVYIQNISLEKLNRDPTFFNGTQAFVEVQGKQVLISLNTTSGFEDEGSLQLRQKHYLNTDTIALCFSLDNPNSLDNAVEKWYPEIRQFCPAAPVVLVGNKSDLKVGNKSLTANGPRTIPERQILATVNRINASAYMECSARYNHEVLEVFQTIGQAIVEEDECSLPQSIVQAKLRQLGETSRVDSSNGSLQSNLVNTMHSGYEQVHVEEGDDSSEILHQNTQSGSIQVNSSEESAARRNSGSKIQHVQFFQTIETFEAPEQPTTVVITNSSNGYSENSE